MAATFAIGGALTAGAQTPPTPTGPVVPGAVVTVEGCLTRESAPPQTAAGAREPAAAMQYVLTERTPPAPFVPDGSASSGAPPMGGLKSGRKLYVLVADDDDTKELAKHLNHIVRVSGASTAPMTTAPLPSRAPDTPPVAAPPAPLGAAATPFGTTIAPTLAVTTLTMVASTCR